MGVSGSGKSTIGKLLSQELNIPFFDGDDFHPKENIQKMSNGQPLNDNDRQSWLEVLNGLAIKELKKNNCIIACSGLKQKYRETISQNIETQTNWIYLSGSFDLISKRLSRRKNHFMPLDLLKSQFDILEEPKDAFQVDISLSTNEIIKTIKRDQTETSEFGIFGLGVMGKSLSRNFAKRGFKISMYNRHLDDTEVEVAKRFKTQFSELSEAKAFDDIAAFVNSLQQPRLILFMVNSGNTVDRVINNLLPHLSKNDVLIDGGNSNYKKTKERFDYLKSKNIHFIGAGVSGGEKGALNGPSIMPSGDKAAYAMIQPYLEAISAKDKNDLPCCTYIGPEGSGHFIKMVHNGIEYVEMQLLAEVTTILEALGQNPDTIAETLGGWKNTASSYLLEITAILLSKKDDDGDWLVKKILDKAGNKGTGNWATIASAELGVPSTLIATALSSRFISLFKEERHQLNKLFDKTETLELNLTPVEVFKAYQFARIMNHYQGFKLINEASNTYTWNLNLSEIARIWTNGCIIKSTLMEDLVETLKRNVNILTNTNLIDCVNQYKSAAKKVVLQSLMSDIATPALSEAVQFLNGMTVAYSSANIIQAQRDFFGAHTYKRIDDDSDKSYHTIWEKLTNN